MEWIPTQQTLPYSDGEYLVSFEFGRNNNLVDIMVYHKKNKQFLWNQAYARDMTEFVTAWMPVPKVYKE